MSAAGEMVAARGVAVWRLNLLRVAYLVMAAGLAVFYWPQVLSHSPEFAMRNGITWSLLAGLGLVAALGLRHPLRMLPVLLFEFAWKAIYLVAFAWPLWRAGRVDDATAADIRAVLMVVVFVPLVPWDYVLRAFVLGAGERWR